MTTSITSVSATQSKVQINSVDALYLGSDGSLNTGQWAGLRNRVINGSARIQQRPAPAASGTLNYVTDRFIYAISSGTAVSGAWGQNLFGGSSSSYWHWIGTVSFTTGQPYWSTRIESKDVADLNSKTITVSGKFYQDSGSTQAISIRLNKPTAVDNYTGATIVSTNTANTIPTGVATSFSATFTLGSTDASNGLAIEVFITTAITVVSKNFAISDVQLEVGSVATPFEQRPYGMELALCQRYYEVCGFEAIGSLAGAINFGGRAKYAAVKRIVPSIAQVANNASFTQLNISTTTSNYIQAGSLEGVVVYRTASAAGQAQFSETFAVSAEL